MILLMAPAAPNLSFDIHRTLVSPESQAKIIHLLFVQELSVDTVARRFGVGRTTIRRIQTAYHEKIAAGRTDGHGH